jgi:hypothetical protein
LSLLFHQTSMPLENNHPPDFQRFTLPHKIQQGQKACTLNTCSWRASAEAHLRILREAGSFSHLPRKPKKSHCHPLRTLLSQSTFPVSDDSQDKLPALLKGLSGRQSAVAIYSSLGKGVPWFVTFH